MYANDRSPVHSGPYAKYGNAGTSFSVDPMIPKDEPGHPIEHKFITAPPSSQCITCHTHPGTTVMNSYLGFMWWDEETDGEFMYPKKQKYPTSEQFVQAAMNNPDEASARGNWSDPAFLAKTADLNPYLKHTQFADFHGHGWVYRSVFKKDRHGNLLDAAGDLVGEPETKKLVDAMEPPERPRKIRRQGRPQGDAAPPDGHPHGEGDALRRLPLHRQRPRQRQALRRGPQRHRDRVHRLPRHRPRSGRPCGPPAPPRPPAA